MDEPTPIEAGFRGLCPRCGAKGLFAGWMRFAPRCARCDLDFAAFNVDDGPAALLIMAVGGVVVALVTVTEVNLHPPWWLQLLLWAPLTLFLVVGGLRLAKGLMLAFEFRHTKGSVTPPDHDP